MRVVKIFERITTKQQSLPITITYSVWMLRHSHTIAFTVWDLGVVSAPWDAGVAVCTPASDWLIGDTCSHILLSKRGKKLDCQHFYEIQHCLSLLPQHSHILVRKRILGFYMRNLLSTRVLLTRFLLPRVLRIMQNICKKWESFWPTWLTTWGLYSVYATYTDPLLYVCEHSCEQNTLGPQVDDAKKQSVKDQHCGFISIKQHIFKGVILICSEM